MKKLFTLIILSILVPAAAAETGVIPYKVQDPSRECPVTYGAEYAKLMGIAAAVKKGFTIYSPADIEHDLSSTGVNPQETVTAEDIDSLTRRRSLDYIISGTLSHTENGFFAESVIYSAARGGIIARSRVDARTLQECAAEDIRVLMTQFPTEENGAKLEAIDCVIILDTSYNMAPEWASVTQGLASFSGTLFDQLGGSRVFLIPFGDAAASPKLDDFTSVLALKSALADIKLKGGAPGKKLLAAVDYAVANTSWNSNSARMILIVSNTPMGKTAFPEKTAMRAKKKGISIYPVCLGKAAADGGEVYSRLAGAGNGARFDTTYHQRVITHKGEPVELYMERGRVFISDGGTASWQDGVLEYADRAHLEYAKPRAFAEEIVFNEKKHPVTPYNLPEQYNRISRERIVSSKKLENNIKTLLLQALEACTGQRGASLSAKPIARVLLSEGNIAFWINVIKPEDLRYFEKRAQNKYMAPLGICVEEKNDEPYGITFNAHCYVTQFSGVYIPACLKVSLGDVIKQPSRYAARGFLNPPLWFINVKVVQVKRLTNGRDIRGD